MPTDDLIRFGVVGSQTSNIVRVWMDITYRELLEQYHEGLSRNADIAANRAIATMSVEAAHLILKMYLDNGGRALEDLIKEEVRRVVKEAVTEAIEERLEEVFGDS